MNKKITKKNECLKKKANGFIATITLSSIVAIYGIVFLIVISEAL